MFRFKKIISILIVGIMFAGMIAACAPAAPEATEAPVETEAPTEEATEEPTEEVEVEPTEVEVVYEEEPFGENLPTEPTITTPLVVAYNAFSQKFSPFFGDTAYDMDVAGMTQIGLLTTDRVGGIVHNAIEGETVEYNGTPYLYKGAANTSVDYDEATDTTKYTARLRVGMKFSDGTPVTADDIIFTYYTYLDPSYTGSTTLSSYDIVGLEDYQTQTTTEVYDKYDVMFDEIFAAGRDHEWSDADGWTQEQQDDLWARWDAETYAATQTITNYVMANYVDAYAEAILGVTAEEVRASEGLQQALAIALWSYGTYDLEAEEPVLVTACTEETFDLVETFPTVEDQAESLVCYYEGDAQAAMLNETP